MIFWCSACLGRRFFVFLSWSLIRAWCGFGSRWIERYGRLDFCFSFFLGVGVVFGVGWFVVFLGSFFEVYFVFVVAFFCSSGSSF